MRAQATPCGVPHSMPSAAATPWAMPRPELVRATPETNAAWLIAARAWRSCGSARSRGNASSARGSASSTRARGTGRANRQMNDSISCVIASSPAAAVVARSHPAPRAGSMITARGTMSGLRMLFLNRRRGHEITALRVASAPVPAVVGIATTGSGQRVIERVPTPSRWSVTTASRSWAVARARSQLVANAATALARSIAAPPPTATTTVPAWLSDGTPARAVATCTTVGSPSVVAITRCSIPATARLASRPGRAGESSRLRRPPTSQARWPRRPTTAPISATRPTPNRTIGGRARSYSNDCSGAGRCDCMGAVVTRAGLRQGRGVRLHSSGCRPPFPPSTCRRALARFVARSFHQAPRASPIERSCARPSPAARAVSLACSTARTPA